MLTPFHKMTVLTVNTMHQNLLCCGARMAFTQSKHGASRLGIPHVHKSGNCKFLNETDPHPNSELEASKHVPVREVRQFAPELREETQEENAHTTRIHAFAECFEVPHPTRGVDIRLKGSRAGEEVLCMYRGSTCIM